MELIIKLGTRLSLNGYLQSWGLFKCDCGKEVEKRLREGRLAKSCGCKTKKLQAEASKNRIWTKDSRQKVSIANKGKKRTEEQNKKQSKRMEGKKHPLYGKKRSEETKQKIREGNIGKTIPEETKQKISKALKGKYVGKNNPMYGRSLAGENSPHWQGGKSFEDYGIEFNKELKQFIKNRDFNICQTPNCLNTDNLDVHHIDYDKKNNIPENLTTLCKSCHMKTNGKNNREYWISYYKEIVSIYL